MIVTFKSKAAGNLIMFGDAAKLLLEKMGKTPDDEGIITEVQLLGAIEGLRRTIAEDKEARQAAQAREWAEKDKAQDAEPGERRPPPERSVSIGQRAVPLLELLLRSHKAGAPVTWSGT